MDTAPTQIRPPPDPGTLGPVIAYWQSLRRGRPVPARTDLDPAGLLPFLSASGIVERDRAGRIRFRLAGRVIAECLGVEPRGMPLRALFAFAARDRIQALATAAFDCPQLVRLTLVAEAPDPDMPPVAVPCALLPLSDTAGTVNRALFCLDIDPRSHILRPCRLQIREAHLTALTPPRLSAVKVMRAGAPALRVIPGGRG
jgi:hypothetical protein